MKEVLKGFSLKITRKDGSEFFASSSESVIFFAHRRNNAVRRKRELKEGLIGSCKVVPVIMKVKEVKS